MASLIHTEERAERLSVCTEQVELQGREGFGGARPGKDTNRALRNDTEFAREMESAAGLGCNRYCEPEKFPTRDCGGIATVSVWRGKLQFSVFSYLPDAPGKEDGSANEKAPRPSLRRKARGSSRQAELTMRSGMPSPFTSRATIRRPPTGPTKRMDCGPAALSSSWNLYIVIVF